MKYLDKIQEFFDVTGLSKEDLLEALEEANLLCQPIILQITDFCNNENFDIVKKIHSYFLEIKLREVLSEKYPKIFNPQSNHNFDPDIPNLQKPSLGLELKITIDTNKWTFGEPSKNLQKQYHKHHLLVMLHMLSHEEAWDYGLDYFFIISKAHFAYIPEHPHKNLTINQSKEFSTILK